jgi:hypothetical protein
MRGGRHEQWGCGDVRAEKEELIGDWCVLEDMGSPPPPRSLEPFLRNLTGPKGARLFTMSWNLAEKVPTFPDLAYFSNIILFPTEIL